MGTDKKKLTWDQFIKIVGAHYPKATPDKLMSHVRKTYGEKIMVSSWNYEACWLYYHQRKLDEGKRNANGKLITKFETCYKVAGSEGFKTWWPRFMGRKYESSTNEMHARNLQVLVNKNKNILVKLKQGKGYYLFPAGSKTGTGLGHTKKF